MFPRMNAQTFFKENGYYHAKGLFGGDDLARMTTDFDRIVDQLIASKEQINARWGGEQMEKMGAQNTVIFHTHNVQHFSAVWHQAFLDKKFLDVTEQLIGPDIVLHHSKLFQKPLEKGAPFPMHQDWTYFPTEKDQMIAAIIHVSDATNEMGCLRVYPGSHTLGRVSGTNGAIETELLAKYPLEKATPLEAKAGDVLFFHYFTLHGSTPNRSQTVRKTVLVQMYAGTDKVEDGIGHPDEHLVLRGWNHLATRNRANAIKT